MGKEKPPIMDKLLPVLTVVFAAMGALVGVVLFISLGEVTESLETLTKFTQEIQPHIPELVKAIETLPKTL